MFILQPELHRWTPTDLDSEIDISDTLKHIEDTQERHQSSSITWDVVSLTFIFSLTAFGIYASIYIVKLKTVMYERGNAIENELNANRRLA